MGGLTRFGIAIFMLASVVALFKAVEFMYNVTHSHGWF